MDTNNTIAEFVDFLRSGEKSNEEVLEYIRKSDSDYLYNIYDVILIFPKEIIQKLDTSKNILEQLKSNVNKEVSEKLGKLFDPVSYQPNEYAMFLIQKEKKKDDIYFSEMDLREKISKMSGVKSDVTKKIVFLRGFINFLKNHKNPERLEKDILSIDYGKSIDALNLYDVIKRISGKENVSDFAKEMNTSLIKNKEDIANQLVENMENMPDIPRIKAKLQKLKDNDFAKMVLEKSPEVVINVNEYKEEDEEDNVRTFLKEMLDLLDRDIDEKMEELKAEKKGKKKVVMTSKELNSVLTKFMNKFNDSFSVFVKDNEGRRKYMEYISIVNKSNLRYFLQLVQESNKSIEDIIVEYATLYGYMDKYNEIKQSLSRRNMVSLKTLLKDIDLDSDEIFNIQLEEYAGNDPVRASWVRFIKIVPFEDMRNFIQQFTESELSLQDFLYNYISENNADLLEKYNDVKHYLEARLKEKMIENAEKKPKAKYVLYYSDGEWKEMEKTEMKEQALLGKEEKPILDKMVYLVFVNKGWMDEKVRNTYVHDLNPTGESEKLYEEETINYNGKVYHKTGKRFLQFLARHVESQKQHKDVLYIDNLRFNVVFELARLEKGEPVYVQQTKEIFDKQERYIRSVRGYYFDKLEVLKHTNLRDVMSKVNEVAKKLVNKELVDELLEKHKNDTVEKFVNDFAKIYVFVEPNFFGKIAKQFNKRLENNYYNLSKLLNAPEEILIPELFENPNIDKKGLKQSLEIEKEHVAQKVFNIIYQSINVMEKVSTVKDIDRVRYDLSTPIVCANQGLEYVDEKDLIYYKEGDVVYCFTFDMIRNMKGKNPFTGNKLSDDFLKSLDFYNLTVYSKGKKLMEELFGEEGEEEESAEKLSDNEIIAQSEFLTALFNDYKSPLFFKFCAKCGDEIEGKGIETVVNEDGELQVRKFCSLKCIEDRPFTEMAETANDE